ncbi:hypothetical protein MLD38_022760 [Melastoma candidum]|nr:hypothetical protein MLD38_022760 [Melastoma candidum]
MERYPNVNAWSGAVAFACRTVEGSCLAAELVLEIGSLFRDGRVDPRKKENASLVAMKPDATSFNLALCGCLLFKVSRKAEELIELLEHLRVKKDARLLVTIARVYERNGRREELKKLHRFIEEAPDSSVVHLCQFYDCLLSCHLKLGDLNSATEMVLEMIRKAKEAKNSIAIARFSVDGLNSHIGSKNSYGDQKARHDKLLDDGDQCILLFEEFRRDRSFDCIKSETQSILARLLACLDDLVEYVTTEKGIIQPTENLFVKLVKAFLEAGDNKGLVDFLVKAEREDSPLSNDDSALIHVINSCIALGWLDRAHDLLDEMSLSGVRTGSAVYNSLMKAYCKANRAKEVTALLRDARKAGIQLDASCYEELIRSKVLQNENQSALDLFREMKSDKVWRSSTSKEFGTSESSVIGNSGGGMMSKLMQEIRGGEASNHGVHDWNNVIHFFCKKRLMNDAEKALKKMRSLGHAPNAQTFHSLVTGYAAIGGKYIEVTELWGEMKALCSEGSSSMKFDQELLDSVLYTFVRGGFFSRANEVVATMEKHDMFIDKFKYRTLFLKYHKTLYKGKAPKFQTEAQLKKRNAALAFKQWVGLQ